MKKNTAILIGIIFLGFILRIYQIVHVPPSASLDEATIGWNAYSILHTGRDEYGYKLPILLRAYDDWRPALYVYLVIPFIKFFGLDVLAVRIPSIILSILSILSVYHLVKEAFADYRYKEKLSLLSSFFLAISPWHIYVSRLGHEASAALSFQIFAFTFLLIFVRTLKSKYIYFSSIFFALSFYTYQSEKIFIPLMALLLSVLFIRELLKRKKHVFLAFVLGVIILIPVFKETLSPNGLSRFSGTSVYNLNSPVFFNAAIVRRDARARGDKLGELINNNRLIYAKLLIQNYISHFNPTWLFTDGVSSDFKAPGSGLLNLFQLPLVLLGVYELFKKNKNEVKILISAWILLSPIPAAITTGSPHALRIYSVLPAWQILGALGLIFLINMFRDKLSRKIAVSLISLIIFVNCLYFLRQYFVYFPKKNSDSFQYAMSQSVSFVLKNQDSYETIVFSNRKNLYQSYMFFLFYSKFDPVVYQKLGGTKSGGYEATHAFGKYEFRPIMESEVNLSTLYIRNSLNFPKTMKVIKTVNSLNGEPTIYIVSKR